MAVSRDEKERKQEFVDWLVRTDRQNTGANNPARVVTTTEPRQTTMTAKEVQDTVNQNEAAANAATALPTAGTQQNAAGNAALQLNGIGLTGGRTPIVPGSVGPYNNIYSQAMTQTMNDLLNPKGFNYDVNADGLYQQIKDNYVKQGRQAMMNTQGQSAALTGGYGNSYGALAGQQAYQESLGNLSNMIPELQQIAYQQYQQEQDDKRNNLEAMNKLEAQEYARWMDEQQLRLELYKAFPELRQMDANAGLMAGGGGGGGGGGGLSATQMADALARAGMTGNGTALSLNETLAWMTALGMDAQQQANYLGELQAKGVRWTDADNPTANTVVGDFNTRRGYGAEMPTVGLKIAGTKAVTGANGTGNNNAVFTSNANNAKLNEGLNTNKKTYGGLFSFGKK